MSKHIHPPGRHISLRHQPGWKKHNEAAFHTLAASSGLWLAGWWAAVKETVMYDLLCRYKACWVRERAIYRKLDSTVMYKVHIEYIQCSAVITQSISPKSSQKTPHSLPMRMRYGMFFVNLTSDACFVSVIVIPYAESWYRQTSDISHTLVNNKIVDHADVVGAAPTQLHLHSRLNTWLQWIGQRQLEDEMRSI